MTSPQPDEARPKQSHPSDSPVAVPFLSTGGRKFALTVVATLGYTALLMNGYIDQEAYVTLQMMTVGFYLGANVAQKFSA